MDLMDKPCTSKPCADSPQVLGVRRTERLLPLGSPLTAVGWLSRETVGAGAADAGLQLSRPPSAWRNGRTFYLSHRPLDELLEARGPAPTQR